MFKLLHQLKQLERPIRIGIVGIGSIGRGMVLQAGLTPTSIASLLRIFILKRQLLRRNCSTAGMLLQSPWKRCMT
jgi:predicted homoserine dehydrogenase-like protein